MKTEHPITPPRELVEQWHEQLRGDPCPVEYATAAISLIATQAARWGADQELEACCEWLVVDDWKNVSKHLRAARRPKPPSLKEQALQALDLLKVDASTHGLGFDSSTIRRALEALPDV
jgi:hypothetical protein